MAVSGIKLVTDFPELQKLQQGLRNVFSKAEMAAVLKDALEKAINPARIRLRELTPRGPTGNLVRAVNERVKAYPRDGNAIGLIGYTQSGKGESSSAQGGTVQAGPDRAFHQWWLEFGTAQRKVPGGRRPTGGPKERRYQRRSPTKPFQRTRRRNGVSITETVQGSGVLHDVHERKPTYIASSYNTLGPFKIFKKNDREFTTDKPYAFFKKSNKPIVLPRVQPGGVAGLPPVRTAWSQSQSQVAFILQQELGNLLDKAVKAIGVETSGTLSGE
jgi:hypothetical protein